MTELEGVEAVSIYNVQISADDLWMNVGDYCGEFHNVPAIVKGVDSPRVYCAMTNSKGSFVIFNTGTRVMVIDLESDREFLEYYEAMDEEIDPRTANELIQLTLL